MKRMKSHKLLKSLLLAASGLGVGLGVDLGAGPALAQLGPDEPIVVVANRAAEPVSRTGQSVAVIDADTIAARQTPVVSDLIATTPGVSVARTGPIGGQTSLFIRGAESAQTLVVIDGVAFNDPSSPSGGFDFGNLLTGDIDRIEVLRGPQSTLWGSQAIGGVVAVTTRQAKGRFEADGSVEGGSYGTASARLGLGGASGPLSWRIAGGYFNTDGVSAFDKGKEADGFRQQSVSGRATYAVTPEVSLDLRALWADGKAGIDGFPPPTYTLADTPEVALTRQFIDYTGLNVSSFGGRLNSRLAFQYAATDRVNDDPTRTPITEFYAQGHAVRAEYQGTWAIADGAQAVFGAEHERTTLRTASPSSIALNPTPLTAAADIDSLYLQGQADAARGLTLTLGGRFDHHSAFGDHGTFQGAAAYRLAPATVLRASFGQGFKAPTLYQLFSPFGFPGLKPERANGWDFGVDQGLFDGKARLSATYFGRRTRDQVDFFGCFPTPTPFCASRPFGYYANIDRTRADGVELTATAKPVAGLSLSANYSYVRAKDDSPGSSNRGHELARRPKSTANATADYAWPCGLTTGAAVRYAGSSFDNAANTVRLKSYVRADLHAAYPIGHGAELYARVEDLFDHRYETAFQYGNPGRAGYIGIRFKL